MSERKATCAHCNACGEHLSENGFCHNKQCSRHGRTNDYLADEAPAAPLSTLSERPDDNVACARCGKARAENATLVQALMDVRARLGQVLREIQSDHSGSVSK